MKRLGPLKYVALMSISLIAFGGLAAAMQTMSDQLKQKAAEAKEAAARNQQALKAYSWIQKTDLSVKGDVKNSKIESCRYGPDGKVQKTELSDPPKQKKKRGLRGKIIAKKTAEMKEELEASAALVQKYVPPTPEKLQAVIAAGNVTISPGGGAAALRFADYEKTGDALTLTLDVESKSMRQISVDTWLDEADNKVTLQVSFQSLPDGTNYAASTVMTIPESKLEVTIENSNYQKVAP